MARGASNITCADAGCVGRRDQPPGPDTDGGNQPRRGEKRGGTKADGKAIRARFTCPDTRWLFPSPQRGKNGKSSKTFRETLDVAREAAKLKWVGFRDFRHYFASACVMSDVDFLTTAKWLGHKDGGILVGKIYGHLSDDRQQESAQKCAL